MNPETIVVEDEEHRVRCQRCKRPMPRSRSDRKWCSQACARAAYRDRKKQAPERVS